jgi:hypothetical protein
MGPRCINDTQLLNPPHWGYLIDIMRKNPSALQKTKDVVSQANIAALLAFGWNSFQGYTTIKLLDAISEHLNSDQEYLDKRAG